MANFDASLTIRDGDGSDSVLSLHVVDTDIAAATTKLQTLGELIDSVILGKVVSATIAQTVDVSGWTLKGSPDANSNVEVKGRIIFSTANPKVKPRVSLPAFDTATWTVTGGSIPIDLNAGSPTSMDSLGVAFVDQNWTDYRYEDFNGILTAYEEFE